MVNSLNSIGAQPIKQLSKDNTSFGQQPYVIVVDKEGMGAYAQPKKDSFLKKVAKEFTIGAAVGAAFTALTNSKNLISKNVQKLPILKAMGREALSFGVFFLAIDGIASLVGKAFGDK